MHLLHWICFGRAYLACNNPVTQTLPKQCNIVNSGVNGMWQFSFRHCLCATVVVPFPDPVVVYCWYRCRCANCSGVMHVQATFRLRVGLEGVLWEACFRFEDNEAPLVAEAVPHGVAAKINKQAAIFSLLIFFNFLFVCNFDFFFSLNLKRRDALFLGSWPPLLFLSISTPSFFPIVKWVCNVSVCKRDVCQLECDVSVMWTRLSLCLKGNV